MANFIVRDSEGASFFPGQTVLDSDGVEYFVSVLVLDSNGSNNSVLLVTTRNALKSRQGTITNISAKAKFI